jgi:ubiquinone/menaquinone biosynthesis C-methylase UbiE
MISPCGNRLSAVKEQAVKTKTSKGYKGMGMEGFVARWYAKGRRNDYEDFRRDAARVAEHLKPGSDVLEVAPGPGWFSIELAKLGDFKITGLDISRTCVSMATISAREAGVKVDFVVGNASAMPFEDESFDSIWCCAAFKNFSEPVKALDEMHRVLRPGGAATIVDLRKDVSLDEINAYMRQSGRSRIDSWLTSFTFKHMLIKRAYTGSDFVRMAHESRFGGCELKASAIGYDVHFAKPAHVAAVA